MKEDTARFMLYDELQRFKELAAMPLFSEEQSQLQATAVSLETKIVYDMIGVSIWGNSSRLVQLLSGQCIGKAGNISLFFQRNHMDVILPHSDGSFHPDDLRHTDVSIFEVSDDNNALVSQLREKAWQTHKPQTKYVFYVIDADRVADLSEARAHVEQDCIPVFPGNDKADLCLTSVYSPCMAMNSFMDDGLLADSGLKALKCSLIEISEALLKDYAKSYLTLYGEKLVLCQTILHSFIDRYTSENAKLETIRKGLSEALPIWGTMDTGWEDALYCVHASQIKLIGLPKDKYEAYTIIRTAVNSEIIQRANAAVQENCNEMEEVFIQNVQQDFLNLTEDLCWLPQSELARYKSDIRACWERNTYTCPPFDMNIDQLSPISTAMGKEEVAKRMQSCLESALAKYNVRLANLTKSRLEKQREFFMKHMAKVISRVDDSLCAAIQKNLQLKRAIEESDERVWLDELLERAEHIT